MRKQHAISILIAASVAGTLLLLFFRSNSDDNNSAETGSAVQMSNDNLSVEMSLNLVDLNMAQELAKPQEHERSVTKIADRNSTSARTVPESVSLFFLSEADYIKVAIFWERQSSKYGSRWLDHLESELSRNDEELNSRALEELSVLATLGDPRYTYDPPLTAEQLSAVCRNLVCKVQLPKSVKITEDLMAVEQIAGSKLDTYSHNIFMHGFGHHVVFSQPAENLTTHFFLANGYEPEQLIHLNRPNIITD